MDHKFKCLKGPSIRSRLPALSAFRPTPHFPDSLQVGVVKWWHHISPWNVGRLTHCPLRSVLLSFSPSNCWMKTSTAALGVTDWRWDNYKRRLLGPWITTWQGAYRQWGTPIRSSSEWAIKSYCFEPLQNWGLDFFTTVNPSQTIHDWSGPMWSIFRLFQENPEILIFMEKLLIFIWFSCLFDKCLIFENTSVGRSHSSGLWSLNSVH